MAKHCGEDTIKIESLANQVGYSFLESVNTHLPLKVTLAYVESNMFLNFIVLLLSIMDLLPIFTYPTLVWLFPPLARIFKRKYNYSFFGLFAREIG